MELVTTLEGRLLYRKALQVWGRKSKVAGQMMILSSILSVIDLLVEQPLGARHIGSQLSFSIGFWTGQHNSVFFFLFRSGNQEHDKEATDAEGNNDEENSYSDGDIKVV